MYVTWGSYRLPNNSTTVTIRKTRVEADNSIFVGVSNEWVMTVRVLGTPEEMTAKLLEIESAFSIPNQNLRMFQDDGTPTVHNLYVNDTRYGVKVMSIAYPDGTSPGQYATYRDVEITVQGETRTGLGNNTVDYQLSVSVTGTGGPRYVVRETRNGAPVRQLVSLQTPVTVQESGSTVYYVGGGAPIPPPPQFPYEVEPSRTYSREYIGDNKERLAWSYNYESPERIALPPSTGGGL
jgi:hypothetical protein